MRYDFGIIANNIALRGLASDLPGQHLECSAKSIIWNNAGPGIVLGVFVMILGFALPAVPAKWSAAAGLIIIVLTVLSAWSSIADATVKCGYL